jgi:hypothetical protein
MITSMGVSRVVGHIPNHAERGVTAYMTVQL